MNEGRSISVAAISQDSFYRDLNPEQLIQAKKSEYNFDHPDTIADEEIYSLLLDLANGKKGKVPEYDFKVKLRNCDAIFLVTLSCLFCIYNVIPESLPNGPIRGGPTGRGGVNRGYYVVSLQTNSRVLRHETFHRL